VGRGVATQLIEARDAGGENAGASSNQPADHQRNTNHYNHYLNRIGGQDMRTKRAARAAAAIIGALALVAACGSDDDSGDASESADATTTADDGTTASDGTTGDGDSSPGELQPVDFHISWLPGGDNLAFWMGVEQGFFEAEGLDVTIRSSNDPTLSIKLAAAGEIPLVQAYTGDVIISAASGDPVVSLYDLTDRSPFGIVTMPDSGITTAEQLEGKTIGVTTLPIDRAFFAAMLRDVGLTEDDVTIVDPGQGGVAQMIAGNLDGTSAVLTYEPIILEAEGYPDANFIYYADYGAPDSSFFNIVANPEWLEDNGDTARAFIRGYRNAVEWTNANTTEAAELFVKQFPEQDAEIVAAIWSAYSEIGGTGEQSIEQWQELADFLEADGQISEPVDVTTFVSNDYIPE
jgi:ABC-type nitrate/sulfonate/bicarbonate transport system substrate-binding protein